VITGLHHFSIACSDADRSLAFYRDLFGMVLVADREVERDGFVAKVTGTPGARVRIVHLQGYGLNFELLEYRKPRGETATEVSPSGHLSPTASPPIVGKGDPYVQARLCYENVRLALEAAGATMRNVVKITTYSTHPDYRKILIEVRKEFFEPPYPASTGVVVTSLYDPAALFEVEAIAVVDR